MALDLTLFGPALKTLYPEKAVLNLVYKHNPLLAMLPKYEQFTGDGRKMPVIFGNPQNRSNTFSTGLAETSTSQLRAFLITRQSNYSFGSVQNETIMASQNDEGAFLRALKLEMDGAINSLARSLAIQAYRTGSGSIGRLSASSGTTTTLTLANAEDAVNFEVGMALESSPNDSATGLNTTTGPQGVITAIDRGTGIITLSAAITGAAASDYLFPRGDAGKAISGIQAWVPYNNRSSALAASFYGVTRNVDAFRLGGITYDGSALTIEEALQQGLRLVAREGGRPDYIFLNHLDYQNLVIALGSKVQYVDVGAKDADVGFKGVLIYGPGVEVTCLPDMNAPVGYANILQMNTWELASLGKAVNLFKGDGLDVLRSSTADQLDFRCFSYSQLGCYAPGWNAVVKLP